MSGTSLSQGHTAFVNGKYEDALTLFTAALATSNSKDVNQVLDARVTTYAALGKLDLARKDAMLMIRRDKKDARGYLRCGQLERRSGDYTAAVKWYEYGLKHVAKDSSLFTTVEAQFTKTTRTVAEALIYLRPKDPFKTLPTELIEMVLALLDYKTVVLVLRVSRLWKQTLLQSKPIRETIDFGEPGKQISYFVLKAALSRLSRQPKQICARSLSDNALDLLKYRLESWANFTTLQTLWVNGTSFNKLPLDKYNLNDLCLRLKGKDIPIDYILQSCPALDILNLSIQPLLPPHPPPWDSSVGHQSLRKLVLEGYRLQLDSAGFACFPMLTVLSVRGARFETGLDISSSCVTSLKMRDCLFGRPLALPATLEVFDADRALLSPMSGGLVRFHQDTACLRDLRADASVESYTKLCETAVLHSLQKLRISSPLSDEEFSSLVRIHSPHLQQLHVEGALITGLSLVDMLKATTCTLEQLVLCNCEKVPADAVAWARQKGVMVEVHRKESKSGREVRTRPD